jgi:hypothetical protein
MKFFCALCILCGLGVRGYAIDREAFTFTHYKLNIRLEPEQHRMAVRGTITLRNDSNTPQKNISLQLSSSLTWRSIRLDQKPLEFISQSYTSDIDHTGALSEAIAELPEAIPPKGTLDLIVGYEGVIPVDTTRLTRIGVPEALAKRTDWDQIANEFTAVRGIGYVVWYPVATGAANLSEGNSVFETIGRWKSRNAGSSMDVEFESSVDLPIIVGGRSGNDVPMFVMADYKKLAARGTSSIRYLVGSDEAAEAYAQFLAKLNLPASHKEGSLQILQIPDAGAAPFISGPVLLTPLDRTISLDTELNAIYALSRQSIDSPRIWIRDGLSHYAQLKHIEEQGGRQAVLSYLSTRLPLLSEDQKAKTSSTQQEAAGSLINSNDDPKAEIKAMWVWWMLHDMCGESVVTGPIESYQSTADKEPSYMQHLVETTCKKDMEWFFDDWIYRDKGLPDFHVVSVYPRKNLKEGYLTTVTVENLGSAGAEVPVTIHDASGDFTERVVVKAKAQASVRFSTTNLPDQVTVNDGSVPESDMSNNTFKIEPAIVDTH